MGNRFLKQDKLWLTSELSELLLKKNCRFLQQFASTPHLSPLLGKAQRPLSVNYGPSQHCPLPSAFSPSPAPTGNFCNHMIHPRNEDELPRSGRTSIFPSVVSLKFSPSPGVGGRLKWIWKQFDRLKRSRSVGPKHPRAPGTCTKLRNYAGDFSREFNINFSTMVSNGKQFTSRVS